MQKTLAFKCQWSPPFLTNHQHSTSLSPLVIHQTYKQNADKYGSFQILLQFSSKLDCILSFNFSLNLCKITPVLSLEQRWLRVGHLDDLDFSILSPSWAHEMTKGHLNHLHHLQCRLEILQSAHLHLTSLLVTDMDPIHNKPLRSFMCGINHLATLHTFISILLIWSSRAEIIWWTGSPIVSLQGWGRMQTDF